MAEFSYQAKTKEAQVVQGIIDAPNQNTAIDILHSKDYIILSLEPVSKGLATYDINQFFSRPNNKDLVIFTRQLSTLIDADMPLSEGLRTLALQVEKVSFRKIISDIGEAVEGGSLLSAALAQYPALFSNFYIKLVQSGEVSGRLHESLLYLANYVERSQAISSKLKSALAYPAFIIFSLVTVTIIMVTYVLPQLLSIFKESGITDLPVTTLALIWVTDFVAEYMPFLIISTGAFLFMVVYYFRTPEGKITLDRIKISMPGLGVIVRNLYLARIAESLSTLMKSGIPILDALRITADLVSNDVFRNIVIDAEKSVKGGGSISGAMMKYKEIPPLFSSMMSIGERTGKMDFILEHISAFYKEESENSIQGISQVIEPALILLLGIGVAILVSSILLPIYSVVSGA
ncbi:MAG: type II secretion system F family protein [Candidatus Yanofskybacteria bacterium]|nr:type II secretion system F family protein [Candidatus Yanofskybacteria bacterium]